MFNGKRLSGWMALAVFATVGGAMVAADPAFAKVDVDKLTISGEIRERYEVRTNSQMGVRITGLSAKGNESSASHRVRVGVGYDLTPDVSFFAQLQDARYFGTECTTTGAVAFNGAAAGCVATANGNSNGVDLHQGYIQLKNVLVPGLSLKAGRQEIIFGDHRLFGHFGWSQIGNAFDGVRLTHSTQQADVDLFWIRVVDNFATAGVSTAGSTGQPAILFPGATGATQASLNQDIYGAYVTLKPVKNWTIEPYFILLQDGRNVSPTTAAGAAIINQAQTTSQTRHFLGGRVNGKAGGLDFTYEGNYQFGSMMDACSRAAGAAASASGACGTLAGVAGIAGQVTGGRATHINANQHAVKTGFTFDAVPMKPRLGFEFNYASGDKCSNFAGAAAAVDATNGDRGACGASKNSYTGADNLYPTNHFHMGYMDLMSWRNMVNYQAMFDVKPSPASKFQINFTWHRLASTADNWYRANQAIYFTSKATNQAASLGQELNLHYWHTFKEKFKFEIGWGHFFTGEYLAKSTVGIGGNPACPLCPGFQGTQGSTTNQPYYSTKDQDWGYVMGSIAF